MEEDNRKGPPEKEGWGGSAPEGPNSLPKSYGKGQDTNITWEKEHRLGGRGGGK